MPEISAKNLQQYIDSQPRADAIFEKHAVRSDARTFAGFGKKASYFCGRRGKWYFMSQHPNHFARLESIRTSFGKQVHATQWEFAERVECTQEKRVQELGYD